MANLQSKVVIIAALAVVLISTAGLVVNISRPTTCDVYDPSRLSATADDDVYDPRKLSPDYVWPKGRR